MDPHCREGIAAAEGMADVYGSLRVCPGHFDGHRRRWSENDDVAYRHNGEIAVGYVMAVERGDDFDVYVVRTRTPDGVVFRQVRDSEMLIF